MSFHSGKSLYHLNLFKPGGCVKVMMLRFIFLLLLLPKVAYSVVPEEDSITGLEVLLQTVPSILGVAIWLIIVAIAFIIHCIMSKIHCLQDNRSADGSFSKQPALYPRSANGSPPGQSTLSSFSSDDGSHSEQLAFLP
jgi:hypothetical protein